PTLPTLTLLRDFGIDPNAQPLRETVALVRENSRWEHAGQPFFAGEVEPCINGRTVAIGAYLGVDVDSIVARLLGEQLADGGWNCETENGSVRASFATTIRVAEGVAMLRSKQQPDGTWLLEDTHPGAVHFSMEDGDGHPSRWNTLRALRVLNWYDDKVR